MCVKLKGNIMENYNPENTCRTCLQQSDELTSLYTKDDNTGLTLLEKLRFCVSLQILVSERMPTNACSPCVRSIAEFCDFKRRCELSEKTLEGMCGEPPEDVVQKTELVYMEEDGGGESKVVAKMEAEESNLSCDDGSDCTLNLDGEEKVNAKCDFKCDGCDELFETESCMQEHYARVHQKQDLPRDVEDSRLQNDSSADVLDHRESKNLDSKQDKTKGEEGGSNVKNGKNEPNFKFACETCGKRFIRIYNLKKHRLLHILQYPCSVCGDRFKTGEEQSLHLQTCSVVGKTAKRRDFKPRDLTKEDKHPCDQCKGSYIDLEQHKFLRHSKRHRCELCGAAFVAGHLLRRHMKHTHKPSDDLTEGEKQPCDQCSGSYVNLKLHKLRRHVKRHRCELCGAAFIAGHRLRRHIEHTHKKNTANYICETCGKAYVNKSTLQIHIDENHSAEKPVYTCDVCGRTYNVLVSLHCHKRTHVPDLRLKCDHCERTYPNKIRLVHHVRTVHEKPYACDECEKRFYTEKKLLKHKGIHVNQASKPYACKVCDKRFSKTSAVSFHMDTQHRSKKHLKCDVCGMEFYNRFHYAAHYSGHTGVKPCQCDGCGMGYNYNRDLTRHKKKCAAFIKLTQQ